MKTRSNTIAWANLFAVNDRESFIEVCQKLFKQLKSYQKVVILNNRHDRPTRVELFANLAIELDFDWTVTFGAYETEIKQIFAQRENKLINLGLSTAFKKSSGQELIEEIINQTKALKILLIGAVNIHTEQAEGILDYFQEQSRIQANNK